MDDRVAYWLELADYDLKTAHAMLQTGRYLYVGFMCHQVIEKALKALVAKTGVFPPKSHRLRRLAEMAGLLGRMSDAQQSFVDTLDPLNIESRYPNELAELSAAFGANEGEAVIRQTEELYEWIRAAL